MERISEEKTAPQICAIGFNLPLDNIGQLDFISTKKSGEVDTCEDQQWENVTNCVALVGSTSETLEKAKCTFINRLWQKGIGADILEIPISRIDQTLVIYLFNFWVIMSMAHLN